MKKVIEKIPIIGALARRIYRRWIKPPKPYSNSENYWIERYDSGGNSGIGSYNELAKFKAEVLNKFLKDNNITRVIEYGCGDGNQLKLVAYPSYIGFDVSDKALSFCRKIFAEDKTKTFRLMNDYKGETAQLTLSLDVIYHLTEDKIFEEYMHRLFDSAEDFVIIYSSDTDQNRVGRPPHIKHWKFTRWINDNKPDWMLLQQIQNRYPYNIKDGTGSVSDFFIFRKI